MLYIHPYFSLDTDKKKVFDENGKEAWLTGNAYWLLQFLCERFPQSVTITDIDDYFTNIVCSKGTKGDEVRDYTEDYIRQLRNDIRRAIGQNVIEYKNKVYSIIGEVKKGTEIILPSKETQQRVNQPHGPEVEIKGFSPKLRKKKIIIYFLLIIGIIVVIDIVWQLLSKNKNRLISPTSLIKDDMVLIPAGDFIMGSTEEEALAAYDLCVKDEGQYCLKEDYLAEYPQRKVYLDDFYIDKKEVSNEEYKIFVEATGHRQPLYWNNSNLNSSTQPVVGVSWDDAQTYCKWLSKRLPTEEEWEKAARGIDGRKWPWGNDEDTSKLNHGKGGIPGYEESDGYKYAAPVGVLLGVSSYGVLNVSGNVFEWVSNEFKAYAGNDKFLNEDFGTIYKIMRGGSYVYGMADNRAAVRFYDLPDYRGEDLGFRCVKDPTK